MQRQSRTKRRSGVLIELTARDEAVLRALARLRLARTSDLVLLLFGDVRRDTAAERLRRLFDGGYLDVHVADRGTENVYSLGPQGKERLQAQGLDFGPLPRGGLQHHLMIVRVWTQLSAAAHAMSSCSLEVFRPDWELREELGSRGAAVIPDGLAAIRFSGNRVCLAIEVDRGTERPPELRRKVREYEAARSSPSGLFGSSDLGLLFALDGAGATRQRTIEQIVREEWASWSVTTRVEASSMALLEVIQDAATAPLGGTPCGKGSDGGPSDCLASSE